ncbi:Holliday junction resolvase RuvX [Candidatus Kaiserbacteria bacterium]|nr:Holliday junction resolvase RuvX [Candidatus Kaiserbacteria bacterium]
MTKYLGIDYGSKRVGVAVSDNTGSVAFPRSTLPNDQKLLSSVLKLIEAEGVRTVVIGESKDKDGKDNPIMSAARRFAESLTSALPIEVYFEPEYYSSVEARRNTDESFVDAKAAAIILNRYLERVTPHGDLS